ncbi:two-component system response regulator BaeR [Fluviicoccus keumensis]|uniref:Two-component system response regulator BaeR n=1 Tax=Fluviicoccus keumensis TaxID=1435465 RepID=A0A4Q7ZBQ4_9GAMM|nr:response regulator [Fluviicoccus keumensis]RZU47375.1 two-component system response regulator BaeR [Fluviicoccus keumensis]
MPEHILIVEDEVKIAELLRDYLENHGFSTALAHHGNAVDAAIAARRPDLMLLDLMLPGRSGLEICKDVRRNSSLPIIMVTARVEEIDRLLGLELGADDYICKPFSPREVVARVKTVLRRSQPPVHAGDGLVLDEERYQARLQGHNLDLTAVEFHLLKTLAARPGRIFNREQLMDSMYADNRIVADRTIDSHIKKIRRKMAAVLPDRELIHAVYSVGYKYEW